jgi:hypothetical protein
VTDVDGDKVSLNTNTRNGVLELGRAAARRRSDADAYSSRAGSSRVDVDVNVNGGVQVLVHVKVNVATRASNVSERRAFSVAVYARAFEVLP